MQRNVSFKNFVPTSSTHRYCARKFFQLWGEAPVDASVTAIVEKAADRSYRTRIEIATERGSFQGEATDEAVLVSIGLATEEIQRSMSDRKKEAGLALLN
jgi:ribosome-associated translation inhibitor RaiA